MRDTGVVVVVVVAVVVEEVVVGIVDISSPTTKQQRYVSKVLTCGRSVSTKRWRQKFRAAPPQLLHYFVSPISVSPPAARGREAAMTILKVWFRVWLQQRWRRWWQGVLLLSSRW